jgi:hypothetical protein
MLLRRMRSRLTSEGVQIGIGHRGKVRGWNGGGDSRVKIRGSDPRKRDGPVNVSIRVFLAHGGQDNRQRRKLVDGSRGLGRRHGVGRVSVGRLIAWLGVFGQGLIS